MFEEIKHIGIFVYPDVDDIEFVGVFDVLKRASKFKEEVKKPLQVDIIASEEMVKSGAGLAIKPHSVVEDFEDYDMIIVPGGWGINKLIGDEDFLAKIRRFSENHMLGSVCNGRRVLEKARILPEKKTYQGDQEKTYREDPNLRVTVRDNLLIAGRGSCSIDLGLKILEMVYGQNVADKIAYQIDFER